MAKISNTGAYPGITNLDALDYLIITDKENDLMTKTATIAQVAALVASIDVGYTSYTALLTQSGVVAPVATVMQDNIGGTMTWSYNSVGSYTLTSSTSAFTAKTVVFVNGGSSATASGGVTWSVDTPATLVIIAGADGRFTAGSLEVRVYS